MQQPRYQLQTDRQLQHQWLGATHLSTSLLTRAPSSHTAVFCSSPPPLSFSYSLLPSLSPPPARVIMTERKEIEYSEKYSDSVYEYRSATLTQRTAPQSRNSSRTPLPKPPLTASPPLCLPPSSPAAALFRYVSALFLFNPAASLPVSCLSFSSSRSPGAGT